MTVSKVHGHKRHAHPPGAPCWAKNMESHLQPRPRGIKRCCEGAKKMNWTQKSKCPPPCTYSGFMESSDLWSWRK
ncbi:hypothetical protein PVAP13_1KG354510 [Panicum virgatum]|uniref:Uncharacterized protein n=1 Tax=Panicum virgatum TaxID=38727 RepID=A0A8T0XQG9_PANVG|nr:hypothetical protein PVAP13_1KG354510 [Panicum virgatum]